MEYSLNQDEIVIRTPFSDEYDLIQVFHGLQTVAPLTYNHPIDFRIAGLQRKGHIDIWHFDKVLSWATDEVPPLVLHNGMDCGGNHSADCAVLVVSRGHGLNVHNIADQWLDEDGHRFYVLRVPDEDHILFLSENVGTDAVHSEFILSITGCLFKEQEVLLVEQSEKASMHRSARFRYKHLQEEKQDGLLKAIRLEEAYDLINPATVVDSLLQNRPEGGYQTEPDLAQGEIMAEAELCYRIDATGRVDVIFDYKAHEGFVLEWVLGLMYQERCDLGAGLIRTIKGLKPFEADGHVLDFDKGVNTSKVFVEHNVDVPLSACLDPSNPPREQTDLILNADGTPLALFRAGFEPVWDGAPEIRSKQITRIVNLPRSRKTYPVFAENVTKAHGIGYRVYEKP